MIVPLLLIARSKQRTPSRSCHPFRRVQRRIIIIIMMSTLEAAIPVAQATTNMEKSHDQHRTSELPIRGTTKLPVAIHAPIVTAHRTTTTTYPTRKLRCDSLDRREALLKGKEGSRQRRRWENGTAYRLMRTNLADCIRSPDLQPMG